MPSLKEIKNRVESVNSTLKITSAMKMVAAAKLHKAQTAIGNMLPYEEMLHRILANLIASKDAQKLGKDAVSEASEKEDIGSIEDELDILCSPRQIKKVALVAYSSNSSLCGGFNTSAVKHVSSVIDEYLASGFEKSDIIVYSVGKKMADAMQKRGFPSPTDFTRLSEKPSYDEAASLAAELVHGFMIGKYDKVELLYNHFHSTSSQPAVREVYLPFEITAQAEQNAAERSTDFIVEPDVNSILDELLPKVLFLKMFTVQLDTNAAEHAARTVAMQTATDNGKDILQTLTLEYNKGRQQKITSEILDIVGGSMQ